MDGKCSHIWDRAIDLLQDTLRCLESTQVILRFNSVHAYLIHLDSNSYILTLS